MLQTIRHFLELIRFSHTVFALPFAPWNDPPATTPALGTVSPFSSKYATCVPLTEMPSVFAAGR